MSISTSNLNLNSISVGECAQVQELARSFAQIIPTAGDQAHGFVAGLYPTDAPTLPDAEPNPADPERK